MDYAADLGAFSTSNDRSQDVTFNPGNSDTGGTTDPLGRKSKSKRKSNHTKSNGLTFSDHEVDVTSMHAGRMVINKQLDQRKSEGCSASIHKRRMQRSANKNNAYE